MKDQMASLRISIESPKTQVTPSRKTSEIHSSKKEKYVLVKEEPPTSEEVMAIMGLALEHPEYMEPP